MFFPLMINFNDIFPGEQITEEKEMATGLSRN